jgi:hypothetical protein
LAIGAPGNSFNGYEAGHVRVYELAGGQWMQLGADIDGQGDGDWSGYAVSLSLDGTRLAIGSPLNDEQGPSSGQVRIYEEVAGGWVQLGAGIYGEAPGDWFGSSVSLSQQGDRAFIGAMKNDGSGLDAGHIRVYQFLGGIWTQLGGDIDGEAAGDYSGSAISCSADGTAIAIGAPGNSGGGPQAGHVRVYAEDGGVWAQLGVDIDGEVAGDFSGRSVSLNANGGRLAVGSPKNSGNEFDAGHVRLFDFVGGMWIQVGSDLDGTVAEEESGLAVSLSADGTRVAIGSPMHDGFGGSVGAVRIYQDVNGVWEQVGPTIYGEADDDWLGWSVSLSAQGNRIAFGATGNNDNGSNAGQVQVYDVGTFIGFPENVDIQLPLVVPIPASEVLYIEVPDQTEFHLYNVDGQQVLTQRLSGGREAIDVSALPPGAYVAELRTRDWRPSRFAKVLVE